MSRADSTQSGSHQHGTTSMMKNARRTPMSLRGLGFLLALTQCQLDERNVAVAPLQPDAGENADANSGGTSGDGPDGNDGGVQLELSHSSLAFGSAVVGFAAFRRVGIRNAGAVPLTGLAVSLSPNDGDLAIAQNQCPTELAPGDNCDVRLQFLPTTLGEVSGVLDVVTAEQRGAVTLSGRGLQGGDLLLQPIEGSSADFGSVAFGASAESGFRIDNPSGQASGILTIDLANPAFTVQAPAPGECEFGVTSLVGGAGCNLRVVFATTERGLNEATLTASSGNMGSVSLGLRGEGLASAVLALEPAAQDFGGIVLGSAARATVSVENTGDVPLTLSAALLAPESDAAFSIVASNCGPGTVLGGLEAAPSCTVELEFRPTESAVVMGGLDISANGLPTQSVTLRGEGLLPGSLLVEPDTGGSANFGDVLIGATATQRFRVSNPGAEPSGTLEITGSGGFEPLAPASGDCVPGTTTLVGGESCTVSVQLLAPARGPLSGTLTIKSALAGSSSLPLAAQGLLPATLVLDRDEVDFGRVVRGTSTQASLTVRNEGDVALPVPTINLGTATSGQASAFTYQSGCSAPLAAGEECTVTLSFAPTAATPYSVTLNFASGDGASDSLLLVARAIEPGSLVLQPAAGSSANFGDVAINTTVTRQFLLTNPGGEPSGRITVSTNDARFSPNTGDCNPVGSSGLTDGSSCTFSVSFTPNSSETLGASLNVSSVGAGDTTLPLTGRGRNPARLGGSNDFNFNTVIRGESATARLWTVTNDGDLPTGTLTTTGGNTEFTITTNNCAARSLAGGQSCTMLVGFTPQGNNARSGAITVADGATSVTLTVRGVGQPLPAVGAACLADRCATGATCENHSNGLSLVCCGQNCTGNQRCSEDQNFLGCELPSVGQGQACGTNVLCDTGLTCNATTDTCCLSSCTGGCRFCNLNGTCGTVGDGQTGTCTGGQVCAQGACAVCAPNDRRCDPNNNRVPQLCSPAGAWQSQPICQFICVGDGFCSECTPTTRRCDPVTGRPQLCSPAGAWQNQAVCAAGSACSAGVCECTGTFEACGNECVDLVTDPDHCGECNSSCFPAQGGTCAASRCAPTPIATGEGFPERVFLSGTHVYWENATGNVLRRVLKTGGAAATIFTGTAGISSGLSSAQIANNQLYFSNATTEQGGTAYRVMRANLDGTSVSAFSPAYVNNIAGSIAGVVTSDTFVFHTVTQFPVTTTAIFRAPVIAQGQAGAGVQTSLGSVTGGIGSMAASGNCLYFTLISTPTQLLRKCSTAAATVHHTGAQTISFLGKGAMDATTLFFREGSSMARIGLAVGSTDVPLTTVNPGLPILDPFDSGALYYFLQTGALGAPACTDQHTLFRAGTNIGAGSPVAILPPPHLCPTGAAVDATAIYWSNREGGTVMKLGK
jgi:hypothetical protein